MKCCQLVTRVYARNAAQPALFLASGSVTKEVFSHQKCQISNCSETAYFCPPPFSSSSILPLFILVLHPSPPCGNSEALLPFFPCNATKQGLLRLEIPAVAAGVLPLMEEKKDVPRIRDSEGCKNRM